LWVKLGDFHLLLGADLEETNDQLTGWSAIIMSEVKPWLKGKARIFKIPHHGSETSHVHDVWNEMLHPNPIAIMSTKLGGRSSIPKNNDIKRIKNYSPNVFCTREPWNRKIRRERSVEKTIQGIMKSRKIYGKKIGQIQIRISQKEEIFINLKDPATPL